MSIREEQCNKVCRILDDVLANRPAERDSLIIAVRKAFESLKQFGNAEQLPSAQPEPRWIPCSERPPEESGDYLVTVAHHSGELWVEVDQFDNENGSWWHYMDDVTAWMPRPEPYKEGDNERA